MGEDLSTVRKVQIEVDEQRALLRPADRHTGKVRRFPDPMERQAVTARISEVAGYLQQHLGQKVTAYLSGINDAKLVGQWASGKVEPRPLAGFRLRSAFHAASFLIDAFGDETAQAWFFGTNSLLDTQAPAYVLRHGEEPRDWSDVVLAAKAFAETAA